MFAVKRITLYCYFLLLENGINYMYSSHCLLFDSRVIIIINGLQRLYVSRPAHGFRYHNNRRFAQYNSLAVVALSSADGLNLCGLTRDDNNNNNNIINIITLYDPNDRCDNSTDLSVIFAYSTPKTSPLWFGQWPSPHLTPTSPIIII